MSIVTKDLLGSIYTVNNVPTGGAKALKYTTIGRLLFWLNQLFMLKDENGKIINNFYTGKHNYKCKPQDNKAKYSNRNPFLTFENHFSPALERFIIPKIGQETTSIYYIKYASDNTLKQLIFGDGTDILDILINIDYIKSQFESKLTSVEETSINIYDLVKEILEDMTNDFGYINDFDIQLIGDTTYYLVDRKVTAGKKDLERSIIDLVGLGSTASNITLNSNLTNETATFSVISAASLKSDIPVENSAMMSWNRGAIDRFIPQKFVVTSDESRTKGLRDKIVALKGHVLFINKELQRLPDVSVSIESAHKAVMTELVAEVTSLQKESPPGLLPIQLSFEIMGISGINIGQSFILEKGILPVQYEGRVSFIVGGVSHKVENNQWITSVTCYMSLIDVLESFTKEGRPSVIDLILGKETEIDIKELNEELETEAQIQDVSEDENPAVFFNVLAKKTVEPTKDALNPSWTGFRAATIEEPVIGKAIKYMNHTKSRKGILHPELVDVIDRAIHSANSEISTHKKIIRAEVTSGGQISLDTLKKFRVVDKALKVRHSRTVMSINHDNGWAADIHLMKKTSSGAAPISINKHPNDTQENRVFIFLKYFFEISLKKGYAPRIGVGYKGLGNALHVGFHPKQTLVSGKAANIWTSGGVFVGDAVNKVGGDTQKVFKALADRYYKAYEMDKKTSLYGNNKSLIPRGKLV